MKLITAARTFVPLASLAVALALAMGGCAPIQDPAARAQFVKSFPTAKVTILPACVRTSAATHTFDPAAAEALAEAWRAHGGSASVGEAQVALTGVWHMNQQQVMRDSAAAFGEFVKAHPFDTEYALLPEYLVGRSEVIGIHAYVVDRQGKLAFLLGYNSHQKVFSQVKPKNGADATTVLVNAFKEELPPRDE